MTAAQRPLRSLTIDPSPEVRLRALRSRPLVVESVKAMLVGQEQKRLDTLDKLGSEVTWVVTPSTLVTNFAAIAIPLLSIWLTR